MLEKLMSLSLYNYLYAAVLAFFLTYIIMRFKKLRRSLYETDELAMNVKNVDRTAVMERCTKMFPIETVIFNGKVFKRGMNVKVTTVQKKIFQGEFVGKNDMDIICIVTRDHIIAHEINKITGMISLDDPTKTAKE